MTDSPQARYGFTVPDDRRSRSRFAPIVFAIFSLIFVSGGIASGYVFVTRTSAALENAISQAQNRVAVGPAVAGVGPATGRGNPATQEPRGSSPTPNLGAIAATATGTPEPEPIGQERISVLLLGVDQRPGEAGPTRTDTMLVVTVDPAGKTAGMLSIPRDLWVPIPLDDRRPIQDRVNTAFLFGELYQFPGGGAALAKKTIQYNFGVRVHYYAKVDFQAFRRIVDTLGGIDVDVPTTLVDNAYPTDDYEYQRVYIPAGCQHLNGDLALKYARSRHQDSDFGRMKRQQAVLLAVRQRALKLDVLPKLPQLALEFAGAIKTDIPIPELLKLAQAGKDIDSSAITARSVEGPAVQPITTSGGADVMLPVRSEVQKLVLQVFAPTKAEQQNGAAPVTSGNNTALSPSQPAATPAPARPACG